MPKPSLYKNNSGTIQPMAGRIRGFVPFPKGISLKMNIIVQQEFEFANNVTF